MGKEEFYFDSRDMETRIHAILWRPEGKARCVLQIVHGMAEYAERYDRLARYLNQEGILVAAEDHLGHGKSRYGRGTEGEGRDIDHPLGYFCSHDPATVVVRDVHRLKKQVQQDNPGIPYLFMGHSMGSFILRNYLCRYGSGIDGALIMGTGMQPALIVKCAKLLAWIQCRLLGQKHPGKLLDKLAFGGYNKKIEAPSTTMDWLSRDREEVKKYLEDPLCGFLFTVNGFATLFELIDRLRDEDYLRKMPSDLPVLFLSGDADPVGDYGRAVEAVVESFRSFGMKQVACKLYPGMRHELVNEVGREKVETDILHWIKKVAGME